jgi:hypothetical protein
MRRPSSEKHSIYWVAAAGLGLAAAAHAVKNRLVFPAALMKVRSSASPRHSKQWEAASDCSKCRACACRLSDTLC